jgi:hypothetical protein
MQAFRGSMIFTLVCLILAGAFGYAGSGQFEQAISMVFIAAVLGVMEVSLSLDNAVVNASILKDMAPIWQKRFLTWGIVIAVFGTRVIFPILIVSLAAMVSPWEATRIALTDHARYEAIVTSAHIGISGFGGAFLLLVGLTFFFDADREHHWIGVIERPLARLAHVPGATYIATAVVIGALSFWLDSQARQTFLIAGLAGIAAYFVVEKAGDLLGGEDTSGVVVRSGAAAFAYLEFLDASFSFDGVIGAFAITNDIVLIALGLAIGAMFVRSMTVALVRGGQLDEYRYLEAGAFHAIVALAAIMLLSIRVEVPEIVTGLIGAVIIGLSILASIRHRKRHPHEYVEADVADTILPTGDVVPERPGS